MEKYKLARENTEWIPGSYIAITFDVRSSSVTAAVAETVAGSLIIKSADVGEVVGGQTIPVSFGFKNTGAGATWP